MKRIGLIVFGINFIVISFIGCTKTHNEVEKRGYIVYGDTVKVLSKTWLDKLAVGQVKSLSYSRKITTAGTVKPIPTLYANIASPFAGRISGCNVQIGQYVVKGMRLFDIICPDFTVAQKEYFQACSALDLARRELQRKNDLSRNGVCSQRELEQAQAALSVAENEYENIKEVLHVYQGDSLREMKLGQPLVVYSPISGCLIRNNIVNGQFLRGDADPVAVVADLSRVWVSAHVKEGDLRFISEGDSLIVDVSAYPGVHMDGEVFHIEEAVDEDTRSVQVYSICNNENRMLKLGMYVTVCFSSKSVELPVIPETSLLQGVDSNYVFVEVLPSTYVRRNIEVETITNAGAIISKGLHPGEKIIVSGGYCLKI